MDVLRAYLSATFSSYFGIAGIFSTLYWVLETSPLKERIPKIPPRWVLTLAFACFSVAQFNVYRDEHQRVVALSKPSEQPPSTTDPFEAFDR